MENTLTLERLIADIGQPLLRLAVDPHEAAEPLTGVLIHDPSDTVGLEAGCLVLCVGLASGSELVSLGREARRAGVCGLAVKSPLPPEAVDCPVPVVEVNRHASWMHVATITRQRIQDYARAQWEPAGATSDLFAIANTVSMVIHAPVTIEDATSAVLAWSAGQEKADESRVETILGRAVRPWRVRKLADSGVFQRLNASTAPVYVEPYEPTMLPRVAVAVRAGSEVLGYVWAVTSGPLPKEHARWLELFTSVVALHLANMRADSSPWARQQRRELAAAMLAGGAAGAGAAREAGLEKGPFCVLAVGLRPRRTASPTAGETASPEDAAAAANLRRLEEVLTLYLTAVHPSALAVRGNGAVYVLTAWPKLGAEEALAAARSLAEDFLARSPAGPGPGYLAAVAWPAAAPGDIPVVRLQADAVLRALGQAEPPRSVATVEDMALPVMLQHLGDIAQSLDLPRVTGPLRRLADHDGPNGILTRTLSTFLAVGSVADDAALRLRVHVNTLRYRLRRIREVSGLDFEDADQMLLAQLQLRLNEVVSQPLV